MHRQGPSLYQYTNNSNFVDKSSDANLVFSIYAYFIGSLLKKFVLELVKRDAYFVVGARLYRCIFQDMLKAYVVDYSFLLPKYFISILLRATFFYTHCFTRLPKTI